MKIKTPNRVTHSHIQTIEGRYEDIFALYCPVKENYGVKDGTRKWSTPIPVQWKETVFL